MSDATTGTSTPSSAGSGAPSGPTSASRYRCAVIGLGRIGAELPDNHLRAYKSLPWLCSVVTCDTIKPADYKDYKEMVRREKLDIVSVCTPPETHRRIVTDIAPYVKAIYCEKPIALTLDDADAMLDCCAYHGVILQINHQRTFVEPVFRFSRGIVNTGSHMFALLLQLFGEVKSLAAEEVTFQSGLRVRLEEQFTQEPVFQFDCTHNGEPMIQKGIKHLIASLAVGCPSDASGERAREALRLCLELKRLKEGN